MTREEAETENIPREGIGAGAGGMVTETVGEEEEEGEGGTEMEAIITTPKMATITTRATITGIHADFDENNDSRVFKSSKMGPHLVLIFLERSLFCHYNAI